jgi:hypothetical protein
MRLSARNRQNHLFQYLAFHPSAKISINANETDVFRAPSQFSRCIIFASLEGILGPKNIFSKMAEK